MRSILIGFFIALALMLVILYSAFGLLVALASYSYQSIAAVVVVVGWLAGFTLPPFVAGLIGTPSNVKTTLKRVLIISSLLTISVIGIRYYNGSLVKGNLLMLILATSLIYVSCLLGALSSKRIVK